uniref:Uncharacterized protein n=1 Tax=Ectopseudomonas oleovorans TaxID=301 RepID=A0A653B8N8_ECTOL
MDNPLDRGLGSPGGRCRSALPVGLGMALEGPWQAVALTVDAAQLGLQVHAPDRRFAALDISLHEQALGDRFEHVFGDERPMERALGPDRRRLRPRHPGSAEQRPTSVVSCQWPDDAFDAGHQAQALAGKAEAARHDDDPRRIQTSAYTPNACTVKPKLFTQSVDNSVHDG